MNMTKKSNPEIKIVPVLNGKIKLQVKVAGKGPQLVYLHPAAGLLWDPFVDRLAENYQVFAPEFPGTSIGDPYAIKALHDWIEVLMIYEEVFRALDLKKPIVVGQSFGGMLAADFSSIFPQAPSKLVLLDPIGLWRDDAPIINWNEIPGEDLPALLFHDPQSAAAQAMLAMPEDGDVRIKAMAAMVWALGSTGKFVWPIPDLGLSRRLYRVNVPTLIVWGEHDRLAPPIYAEEYAKLIKDSRIALIPGSGHIPQVEALESTWHAVSSFLEETSNLENKTKDSLRESITSALRSSAR